MKINSGGWRIGNIFIFISSLVVLIAIGVKLQLELSQQETPWIGLAIPCLWALPAIFSAVCFVDIGIKKYRWHDDAKLAMFGIILFSLLSVVNLIIYFIFHF